MNVSTIQISQDEALRKLEQYKAINAKLRTREDEKLQTLYASVSKGARVINVAAAFRQTGLNEKQEPKLAMARADWKTVHCHRNPTIPGYQTIWDSVGFTDKARWNPAATTQNIILPKETLQFSNPPWRRILSPVPHLPPPLRPRFGLHNYHILFEVEEWKTYPVDPFLLRKITGQLYVVEAEWELTALEASLLSAMVEGN